MLYLVVLNYILVGCPCLRWRSTCKQAWQRIVCLGKPDIPVGKSNGSRHSVWGASEIRAVICGESGNFPPLFSLFRWFGYTAISRKVVGKSARDNPEKHCGWFWVHCFLKKFQRMAREAMEACLRVLKENNKSRFDSYNVRKIALIISHITFRNCVHSFSDNLSRNSCIL